VGQVACLPAGRDSPSGDKLFVLDIPKLKKSIPDGMNLFKWAQ